jgi:hypothetical protein
LFTEPGGNNRLARQIARDAEIKLAELDPIESGPLSSKAYEDGLLKDALILERTLK